MIEAMSIGNAMIRLKKENKRPTLVRKSSFISLEHNNDCGSARTRLTKNLFK